MKNHLAFCCRTWCLACDTGKAGIHNCDRPNLLSAMLTTRQQMPIDVYTYYLFSIILTKGDKFSDFLFISNSPV